jgi:hypothetical protein
VFPVDADPSAIQINDDSDDTYVKSGSSADHSNELNMEVGGPQNAIGLMHFGRVFSRLRDDFIVGVTLNVVDTWSGPDPGGSCTATTVSLRTASSAWAGGDDSWDDFGSHIRETETLANIITRTAPRCSYGSW